MICLAPSICLEDNKPLICVNDDSSISNETNNNIFEFNILDESLSVPIPNSYINQTTNKIINPDKLTDSCSINSNFICTDINLANSILPCSIEKYNFLLNHNTENESTINNASSLSVHSNNLHNGLLFPNNECVQKLENDECSDSKCTKTDITNVINESVTSVNNSRKKDMCFSDNKHSNDIENNETSSDCLPSKIEKQFNQSKSKNVIEDNRTSQSNNNTNDSNLSEKTVASKSFSNPNKSNIVTTEPYPKYTPTVEKAIKKYENKQPKKECILM